MESTGAEADFLAAGFLFGASPLVFFAIVGP
jgi:hypothetical protein